MDCAHGKWWWWCSQSVLDIMLACSLGTV